MRKIKTFVLFCQKLLYDRQITNSRSVIEQTRVSPSSKLAFLLAKAQKRLMRQKTSIM